MTMLRLGVRGFSRNLWFNLFVAAQLAVALFLTVTFVSSAESRYSLYLPFAGEFGSPGRMEVVSGAKHWRNTGNVLSEAEFLSGNQNLKSIIAGYISPVANPQDCPEVWGYDPRIIERVRPKLDSGSWLRAKETPSGAIPAVITANNQGIQVDDVVDVEFFTVDGLERDETVTQQVRIVGVLAEGIRVPIPNLRQTNAEADYQDFFGNYSFTQEEKSVLIVNVQDLESRGLYCWMNGYALVTYQSAENREAVDDYVQDIASGGEYRNRFGFPMEEVNRRSIAHVLEQVELLLPIVIVLLLLVFTGSFSVSAIHTKKQLRSYAVYYINGSRWMQCGLIHVYSAIIESVLAILLCAAAFAIAGRAGWLKELAVSFGSAQFLACGAVVLLSLLFSCVMPFILLGRSSAKTILYTNN